MTLHIWFHFAFLLIVDALELKLALSASDILAHSEDPRVLCGLSPICLIYDLLLCFLGRFSLNQLEVTRQLSHERWPRNIHIVTSVDDVYRKAPRVHFHCSIRRYDLKNRHGDV